MPTGLSSETAEDGVQLSATKVTVTAAFDAQQSAFLCTMKQEFNSGQAKIAKGAFRCELVSKPWISSLQVESEEKMITMARSTKRLPVLKLPGGDDDWHVATGPLSPDTNYSVELIYARPLDASASAFEVVLPTAMAQAAAGARLSLSVSAPAGWFLGTASHGHPTAASSIAVETEENLAENVVLFFTTEAPASAAAPAAAPAAEATAPEAQESPAPEEPEAEEPEAEEPKAEEPKVEEPKAEEPKIEEPKAEEPKAEEPKAEEPKAEEPKAEEPKAEEPKAEEVKAEEPKAEEAKAEEAKAEEATAEAKAEEAKAEEAKTEEAKGEETKGAEAKGEAKAEETAKQPERYNKDKADEYVPPNDDDDDDDDEEGDEDDYSDEEESEEEEEATGKYSIDFLMGFREANTQRPDDMPPDLDIILGNDPQGRGGKGGDRRRRKNRRQGGGGGGGGGGRNGRRDSNDKREKDNSGPSMLKQSDNGWKRPDRNQEGEEAARVEALRKANGILNRLTYENYESLTKQLEEIAFKDVLVMTGVISLIFDKALSGQKFSKIYAELCDQFNKNAPVLQLEGADVSFLKLLLNKCQEEFENKPLTESVKLQYGDLSDYEIEVKMKARLLSNIKFIGELFLLKMLPTIIVKECVVRLFGDVTAFPPEDDLESLCRLLMTTGKTLEKVEPDFSRIVFEERFRALLDRKDIEPRCKFMIMDLLDLRHNRWVPKRKELVPTTIKEVHAAAKKDEMQQKQKSLTRSADNVGRRGGGGRGGHGDEWSNRRGGGRDRDGGYGGKKGGKFGNRRDSDSRGDNKHQKGGRKSSLNSSSNAGNSGGGGGGNAGGDSGWETVGGNKGQRSAGQKQRGGQAHGAPGWKSQSDNHVQTREGGERGGKSRNAFTALKQANEERSAEKKPSGAPARGGFMSRLLQRNGGGGGFKARPRAGRDEEEEEEEKQAPANNFSPEEIARKVDSIIVEYADLRDPDEAMECMKELCSPESHFKLVEHGLRTVTKAAKIAVVEELLVSMFKLKVLKTDDIVQGISAIVASLDDIVDDVPLAPAFIGTVTGHMVNEGMLPLILVKEPLATIVDSGMAAQMLCTTLTAMMEKNDAAHMKQHIAKADISFAAFTPEKKREDPEALKALVKDDALKAILFEE